MKKSKLIDAIIKASGAKAEEVFDALNEMAEGYLQKLLKVIEKLEV